MRAQKEKPSKLDLFNAALSEAGSERRGAPTTSDERSSRRTPDSEVEGTQGEAQQAADAGASAARTSAGSDS